MQTVQGSVQSRTHRSFRQGLLRDWQRWTRAERVTAGCLMAIIFLGASFFILSAIVAQPI